MHRLTLGALALALATTSCIYDWDETWKACGDLCTGDARPDKDAGPGLQDGPFEYPVHKIRIATADAGKVLCHDNELAVGGGGECPSTATIALSRPTLGPPHVSWVTGCTPGKVSKGYAICLKDTVFLSGTHGPVFHNLSASIASTALTEVRCSKNSSVLISGGCACLDQEPMTRSAPLPGALGDWHCSCKPYNADTVFGVCLKVKPMGYAVKFESGNGKGNVTARCPWATVALGGGCDGVVKAMVPSRTAFRCEFTGQKDVTAWVLCASL